MKKYTKEHKGTKALISHKKKIEARGGKYEVSDTDGGYKITYWFPVKSK